MATTTFSLVRANQVTQIHAVTPTLLSNVPFRLAEDTVPFEEWAEKQSSACFRRFTIQNNLNYTSPLVSNTDLEIHRVNCTLLVAYPLTLGTYGLENYRSLDDLIESDIFQLDTAIGTRGYLNYIDGQNLNSFEGSAVSTLDKCKILSMEFLTEYHVDV